MMKSLQSLFDRLVGLSRYEAMLRSQAHLIFGQSDLYAGIPDTPACWRRAARVRSGKWRSPGYHGIPQADSRS